MSPLARIIAALERVAPHDLVDGLRDIQRAYQHVAALDREQE